MNTENIFLVKRAQRRDKDAFCELMDLQMKDMYRVAIAILASEEDAGDAMQDTILSCWEKIDTLKKPQYFKTWLTRIADNKVTDYFRSGQYHESIVTQIMDQCEESAKYDEYNIELKEAFRALDERYRLPIELFYGQGYKVKEIAALTALLENTIKTYLSRGRKQLAKFYGEENSYDGRKNIIGRN